MIFGKRASRNSDLPSAAREQNRLSDLWEDVANLVQGRLLERL